MTIGPALPPHLVTKRKRSSDESDSEESQSQSSRDNSRSPSPESRGKRRRAVGPAPPPAPIDKRPEPVAAESDASSSDDGFGPNLPFGDAHTGHDDNSHTGWHETEIQDASQQKSKRDEWMMMPPKQDDLSARMDPTKMRSRGFNMSKGARASKLSGDDSSAWTETPEQKRKRLEDEVLGTSKSKDPKDDNVKARQKKADDEDKAKKIREHNVSHLTNKCFFECWLTLLSQEAHRGKSLLEQHQRSQAKKEEDDPSKRGFDYKRDMEGGKSLGHAERKQMLNRAADFGSKFQKGSYL